MLEIIDKDLLLKFIENVIIIVITITEILCQVI